MITSGTLKRKNSGWTHAAALLMAAAVLPLGLATADEDGRTERYRSVEEKIQAAVESGDLTEAEAQEKLVGLRRRMAGGEGRADDRKAKYNHMARRIRMAVEAGDLTPEEGRSKLASFRKEMAEGDDLKARFGAAAEKIRAAEAAGEITPEEAREKHIRLRRRIAAQGEHGTGRESPREVYVRVEAKMQAMVDKGEISQEAMQRRLGEMKRMMAGRE